MPAMPRPITPPYYPIIYVRGYAATMRQIEETVGTPYMGFNLGWVRLFCVDGPTMSASGMTRPA